MTPRWLMVTGILCLSTLYMLLACDAAPPAAPAAADERAAQQHLTQGLRAFQHGDFEQAEREWSAAAKLYEDAPRPHAHSVVLTHLAHAYQALGHYRQALASLEKALPVARQLADRALLASILGSLGNVYAVIGPVQKAEEIFRAALVITRDLGHTELAAVIWNNLGNLYTAQKKSADALHAYQESIVFARQAAHLPMVVQALANAAAAAIGNREYTGAHTFLHEALARADELPHAHDKAYSLINIGLTSHQLRPLLPSDSAALVLLAWQAFTAAADVAQAIGDRRAASYAWGYLGTLYEGEGRYEEAWQLTQKAIVAVQHVYAPESLYRWQWQTGRLHKSQNNIAAAIAAYRQAVATLQTIRPALPMSYGKAPTVFRESLGPVYFELVDLLLQRAAALPAQEHYAPYLHEARDTIELFKAAELRDYFQDDCVDAAQRRTKSLDVVAQTAIIIYPILLPDRLELLVSLPTGLTRVAVPVAAATVALVARRFRLALQDSTTQRYILHAQTLYDWLIRPLAPLLASVAVETLVFVPDGALRLIPMAALHDGQAFLIQKYALATTPGLDLTDPRALARHQSVLAVGVSKSVQGYADLPYANSELQTIVKLYGGKLLLDENFLLPNMERELRREQFGMVHIASHGQFTGDVKQSFVLTFDDKLTLDRLRQFVRPLQYRDAPLELLTLSACETAVGDDQAALGLAGIAVKAGARSALATLWKVPDQAATMLVVEFYQRLQDPAVSRAAALQQAQVTLLKHPDYSAPLFWASFLLINNWL